MFRLFTVSLLASSLLWPFSPAQAQSLPLLRNKQLHHPPFVAAWLRQNGNHANRLRAQQLFDIAVKEHARQSWDNAGKAYAASALHYPGPHALNGYAEARLRALAAIRARHDDRGANLHSDLRSVESLYRSALAADSVVASLSAAEKAQTRHKADCIAAFLGDSSRLAACAPLQAYYAPR